MIFVLIYKVARFIYDNTTVSFTVHQGSFFPQPLVHHTDKHIDCEHVSLFYEQRIYLRHK